MNERELSLVKYIGETLSEHLSEMSQHFTKQLQDHRELIDEKLKLLEKSISSIEIPDVKGMISAAINDLPEPVIQEIPDVAKMVKEAVATLELPTAPELPDIATMIDEAVSQVEPRLPELPDISKMVADEVSAALVKLPVVHDGVNGKDALDLEILPDIDEAKSYPRGTYATHNGGLWRSFQKTVGQKGWESLVAGLSGIEVTQKHAREFTLALSMSDGEVIEKEFVIPAMIYRGVFKHGETYQHGDTVTWGGSLWHCDENTADKPGEVGAKGWTLAAKRGRDGKDKPHG